MRDDDDRVREVREEVLEPVDRGNVEVVCRLVEQEDVGRAEECLCEQDAHLFRWGEFVHLEMMLVVRDAETVQQLCRLRLCVPAVELGELCLELRGAHPVLVGEIGLLVKRILFVHDLHETCVSHDDRTQYLDLIVGIVILLQDGETLPGRDLHDAARRLDVAREQLEEGRFPRAVRADDAVAIPGSKLQIDVLVEDTLAELQAEIVDGNHLSVLLFYLRRMARNIERMLCPYESPGTAQRPFRSCQLPSVPVP